MLKWQDPINTQGETFGFNNDFTCYRPLNPRDPLDGLLFVNHEYPSSQFVSGHTDPAVPKTQAQVEKELDSVGCSILRVRWNAAQHLWEHLRQDLLNRRITARTPFAFSGDERIQGSQKAEGTLANCSGGVTPWGNFLTCEENYDDWVGECFRGSETLMEGDAGWAVHFRRPPEHYGWVVEIDPLTGQGQKLVSLGRFKHEGAKVVETPSGRCVVYMGDDEENQFVYKFLADGKGSLGKGTLYVADTHRGRWLSLKRESHPELIKRFASQTEIQVFTREAAECVGATPLDRPEGIDVCPLTGQVFVSLTNAKGKNNPFGSLLKIREKHSDPLAMEFEASTYVSGGPETGFACPDNILFDRRGNLWMTTDMSGSSMNKGHYQPFKNNALFVIPARGPKAGQAVRVASAPTDAEFTGPSFAPDYKTLFLCVQHPGEESKLPELTSHWPEGGSSIPKPSVVAIRGPLLDSLVS
jgi:secreted PhoX family phosphatase